MSKEEQVLYTGLVTEKLPNAMFRVKLENGHTIIGHTAGRMRRHRIRVMVGDRVNVEITPYDLTRGRITFRHHPDSVASLPSSVADSDGSSV